MAFISDDRTGGTTLYSRFANLRSEIANRAARRRLYRTTVNELRSLTQRELHDMGIGAGDITRIAYEAAYK